MNVQEFLGKAIDFLTIYGIRLVAAIVIFVVGRWVAKLISKAVKKLVEKAKWGKTLSSFLSNLTYFTLLIFVILAAINKLGVQTTSFVAVLGAASLAVGFALQGSLSNFASGVMLVIFRPFKVGDLVDAGGKIGVVQSIQIFNTILASPTGKKIIVPNAQIISGAIENYSPNGYVCVDMVFGIGYEDDLRKAKKILMEILQSDDRILKEPAPTVNLMELGDSSVNFAVRPYTTIGDYWGVYFYVYEQVKLRFDDEGISIPYPQTDVHLYEEKKK